MGEIVQTALRMIYPPQCLICREMVESDFGLCGACWRDTPFLGGLVCDGCGTPLPGSNPDEIAHCDACLAYPRGWDRARAALLYHDNGRRLVLGMKHNDRNDIARIGALWLAYPVVAGLVESQTVGRVSANPPDPRRRLSGLQRLRGREVVHPPPRMGFDIAHRFRFIGQPCQHPRQERVFVNIRRVPGVVEVLIGQHGMVIGQLAWIG